MLTFIADAKNEIDIRIDEYLDEEIAALDQVNEWGSDSVKRLKEMSVSGKTIRGALAIFGYEMSGGRKRYAAVDMAVALELFQSAVLIHDDIIDRDDLRRGKPTIASQYSTVASTRGYANAAHFGMSQAICTADLGFFLAFRRLATLDTDPAVIRRIIALVAREMSLVGLGEMGDIGITHQQDLPTEEAVNSMYRYKTARYTFSLPLMAGAMLAQQPDRVIAQLEELGEILGLIFQLKDDDLALFGSEAETGKAVGNDIRENKKTLHAIKLFHRVTEVERAQLQTIFGNPQANEKDISLVREKLEHYGVREAITAEIDKLKTTAETAIAQLPFAAGKKTDLTELVSFLQHRTK